jgi:putative FmdB family regulatory protein
VPTYEYRCPEGHEFEHFFLSISSSSATMLCPQCGRAAERKISAGSGLVFKGSGFYITDYGKDGKKDLRRRKESTDGGEGTSSTSESKVAKTPSGEE